MFPDFNRWILPLLILVLQGLIFVALLLYRYFKKRNISDLFLGLILLLTCYSQTCYTVGYMAWYNEFRTTKINYFLINIGVALASLIYLYVKSITTQTLNSRKPIGGTLLWPLLLSFIASVFTLTMPCNQDLMKSKMVF